MRWLTLLWLLGACGVGQGGVGSDGSQSEGWVLDGGGAEAGEAELADGGPGPAGELTGEEVDPPAEELGRLRVMTFNVLCFFCNDVEFDPWEERLDYFADIFARHQPDLIGLQELLFAAEVEQMLERSPGYGALFFADAAQQLFKEYADATIFYRTERFEVVEEGSYWLSETPDTPLSGGWARTNLPRLVSWARLRQKGDGREFYFASTHFDNNPPNQEMSAPLVVERTRQQASEGPAIVVGDFNSNPSSPAYAVLNGEAPSPELQLLDSFALASEWEALGNQAEPAQYDPGHRIDHIFLAGPVDWQVLRWTVDMYQYGPSNRYPSDHFAIVAEILW